MSPGNVAREGIPFELFRSTYPGRHVARERYPQRQVARDTPDLSLEYNSTTTLNWHLQFVKRFGENVPWELYETEILRRFGDVYDDLLAELKILKQSGDVQFYQYKFEMLLNKFKEMLISLVQVVKNKTIRALGSCPNVNRVDMMPTTSEPINTTTTSNVAQSVVDENLPQLLDSRDSVTDIEEDQSTAMKSIADSKFIKKDYKGKSQSDSKLNGESTKRIDDLTKGKSEKGKIKKGKPDKGVIAESFDWDDESVSSEDEGITKIRAFMAIAKDESFVGKANTHILFCLSYYGASHLASYRAFH
ncbi:hypothetical protein Tco_0818673 [Tanacetum coccineum]